MSDQLTALESEVRERIAKVETVEQLDRLRTEFLGRKGGRLSLVLATLGKLPKEERAEVGRLANETKAAIEEELARAQARIEGAALDATLSRTYDVTLDAIPPDAGSLHLLRRTLDDVVEFFRRRGFAIVLGPEVESDYFSFEAMNIPADHPARDALDTFYLPGGALLRPHTSP